VSAQEIPFIAVPQPTKGKELRPSDDSGVSAKPSSCPREIIDSSELARRLGLPVSWVKGHTRNRTRDELPCLRFGKYVRFDWNSPQLQRWIEAHRNG
jgi:hypothetical protein